MCVCACVCVCASVQPLPHLPHAICPSHIQCWEETMLCATLHQKPNEHNTGAMEHHFKSVHTHSTNSQCPLHTDIVSHTHTIAHTYTDKGYMDLSIVDKMSCHLRQSPDEPPAASLGESTRCELNSSICTPDLNHAATIPQCSELNVVCIPCLYPQDTNTHIGPTQVVSMLTWFHTRGVISCRTTVKAQLLHYS